MIVCEGVETSRPFCLGSGWPGPAPSPGLFSYLGRCPPCRAPGAQPPGGGRSQSRSVACTRHRLPPCPERVQLSCERGTEAVSSWPDEIRWPPASCPGRRRLHWPPAGLTGN